MSKHSHVCNSHTVLRAYSTKRAQNSEFYSTSAMAASTVQRAPLCIVCGQAIIEQYNRFKCTEAGGSTLTKLGSTLEDVANKADIQLKIAMGTVSHMCRRCREFILRIDKTYQNVLSMQRKLQDLVKPRLATADVERSTICSKSPDREQQHSWLLVSAKNTAAKFVTPKKNTAYLQSKRTLTPVHDNEPTSKKPMRLLLPKPTKRSLPSPQTRTGLSPATKRTTVIRSQAYQNKKQIHRPLQLIQTVSQMHMSHQQVYTQLSCRSVKKR